MTYCHWSSDNFKSDIYCYESDRGFVIHVAAERVVGNVPRVPSVLDASVDEYVAAREAQSKFLAGAERRPVGLRHDGQIFVAPTPQACLERLTYLDELGYLVPARAFDGLKDDIAEAIGADTSDRAEPRGNSGLAASRRQTTAGADASAVHH